MTQSGLLLQTLAHTFQSMGQDEGAYQEFVPLALHLATDYFLMHQSKDVQLLIACCIADVLRVYAPEAPYKDPEQVKVSVPQHVHLRTAQMLLFFYFLVLFLLPLPKNANVSFVSKGGHSRYA